MEIITGIVLFLQILLLLKMVQMDKVLREIKKEREGCISKKEEVEHMKLQKEETKESQQKENVAELDATEQEKLIDAVLSEVFT